MLKWISELDRGPQQEFIPGGVALTPGKHRAGLAVFWLLALPLLIALAFRSSRLESNEQAPDPLPARRSTRPLKAPAVSSSARTATLAQPASSGAPVAQSPATEFSLEALNFDQDATLTDSYQIPPDPCGAVGPQHLISVVNSALQWCDKAGGNKVSKRLGKNDTDAGGSFFEALSPVEGLFDPKVLYDQHAGRFLVVALEQLASPDATSRILLAVSATDDPNGAWYYQALDSKLKIGPDCWADYPGLAVDEEAVYVTANMFSFGGGTFEGARLWIIGKAAFYSGGTAVANVYDPGSGFSFQPAHVYGAGGVAPNAGTFLVSTSLSSGSTDYLRAVRVDNPLGAAAFNVQDIPLGDVHNTAVAFPNAPQLGTSELVSANDSRTINAVWRNNKLYAVNTVNPPLGSGPDAGQATAHWYIVDTTTLSSLALLEQGSIGGEEIAPATSTFMPSIAVDKLGNMAVGFSASAASIYPGAYYTVRYAGGTFQPPGTVAAGVDYYIRKFGGSRNRWGDYSATLIDPSDELTFWAFNEYAMARGTILSSYPAQDGRWATRWARFRVARFRSDFDGDRKDDILFRHPSSGDVLLWLMK